MIIDSYEQKETFFFSFSSLRIYICSLLIADSISRLARYDNVEFTFKLHSRIHTSDTSSISLFHDYKSWFSFLFFSFFFHPPSSRSLLSFDQMRDACADEFFEFVVKLKSRLDHFIDQMDLKMFWITLLSCDNTYEYKRIVLRALTYRCWFFFFFTKLNFISRYDCKFSFDPLQVHSYSFIDFFAFFSISTCLRQIYDNERRLHKFSVGSISVYSLMSIWPCFTFISFL